MAVSSNSTRLGCGRDIDDVWATIDRPPNAHEVSCPFCQHARADLTRLADLTTEQRRADLDDPELQPSPQVLTRILQIARSEVRRGRRLPLDEPTPAQLVPPLTVSEQAVSTVVRHAGDQTPNVQVRRVRVELVIDEHLIPLPAEPSGGVDGASVVDEVSVGTEPDVEDADSSAVRTVSGSPESRPARVAVFLQVSVGASAAIPAVIQDLRRTVREAVENEVGMDPVRVDVIVEDIHLD